MEKIRDFVQKNRLDIISLLILSFFCILTFIIKCKTPVFMADVGREVYTPQLILQGKLLYKDVFMMHPPLSYQLNAVLYFFFGSSFKTLLFASIINAYIIVLLIYTICRQFMKPIFSLSTLVFVTTLMFYTKFNVVNYIYPYSYGMVYGICAFLFFVLFTINYFKQSNENKCQLYFASLFLGFAFACKQDFVFLYLPFFIALILKKENIKTILLNILCFSVFPMLSWGVLFLQGLQLSDVFEFLKYQSDLMKTSGWYVFTYGTDEPLYIQLIKRIKFVVMFLVSVSLYFSLNTFLLKKLLTRLENILLMLFGICGLVFVNVLIILLFKHLVNAVFYVILLPLPILCILKYKKQDKDRHIFLFLTVLSFLFSVRELFTLTRYAMYLFILPAILNIAYVFQSNLKEETKKAFCVFLILFSLVFASLQSGFTFAVKKLETPKGSVYMLPQNAEIYKFLVNWVGENTKNTDRILVLPEAPLLNFLVDRPTDNRYFQLTPDHIEAFGEKNIIKDLEKNPPEYIILQSLLQDAYGASYLGVDYAMELNEFINNNYDNIVSKTAVNKKNRFGVLVFKHK